MIPERKAVKLIDDMLGLTKCIGSTDGEFILDDKSLKVELPIVNAEAMKEFEEIVESMVLGGSSFEWGERYKIGDLKQTRAKRLGSSSIIVRATTTPSVMSEGAAYGEESLFDVSAKTPDTPHSPSTWKRIPTSYDKVTRFLDEGEGDFDMMTFHNSGGAQLPLDMLYEEVSPTPAYDDMMADMIADLFLEPVLTSDPSIAALLN